MGTIDELYHPPVPGVGALPYKSLKLNSPAPVGVTRPFMSGEYMLNPNGSWSSEMATTVSHSELNGGRPTNVPTLWLRDGKPVRVTDDQAARLAAQSNLSFPAYNSLAEAQRASIARENNWQSVEPQNSGAVPTIWSLPTPTPRPDPGAPPLPFLLVPH